MTLLLLLLALPAFACDLSIQSVNLLDIEARQVQKNVDVEVTDGKISAVVAHKENSGCEETLDGKGKFLMPGLVDMHVHSDAIFLPRETGYNTIKNTIPLTLEQSGAMMLAAGVTGFLDLCSAPQNEIFAMRDKQRAGKLKTDMPDIYAAGTCITSKWFGHVGDPGQFNDEKEIADVTYLEKDDTYEEAYPTVNGKKIYGYMVKEKKSEFKKIDALLAKKPDVVKAFYTVSWDEGAEYPSLHADSIREIAKRAAAKGIPVLAHALNWQEQLPLLDSGITGFAHAPDDSMPRDMSRFKSFQSSAPFYVTPTVTVYTALKYLEEELGDAFLGKILAAAGPEVKKQTLAKFRGQRGEVKENMNKVKDMFYQRYQESMIKNVRKYQKDNRFTIMAGSDGSNLGLFLGFSLHQELRAMVEDIGFSEWEALESATIVPGKFFGVRYGSKVGDVANLVLLGNSPVEDIMNTRSVERVVLRGKVLEAR